MKTPQIHIIFELVNKPRGGGNQFLKALRDTLRSRNLYTDDPISADIVLFNSYQYVESLLSLKLLTPAKLVVHRIDGPITIYNHANDYRDTIIRRFNSHLADGTIYQSDWSRAENGKLRITNTRYNTVVHNAPDPTIFNGIGKVAFSTARKIRLLTASWSANVKKGFDTYAWLDEHLDFSRYDMTFIGNSPVPFRNIICLKPMNSGDLAAEMKLHDIFIFASEIEACSNLLLEALHCHLPVIARNSSSNPEVLGGGGLLFNEPKEIPQLLDRLVREYQKFQEDIRIPSLDDVTNKYIDFFNYILHECEVGRYSAKRLNFLSHSVLSATLLFWKIRARAERGLQRVRFS